jgi:hypothetical protein
MDMNNVLEYLEEQLSKNGDVKISITSLSKVEKKSLKENPISDLVNCSDNKLISEIYHVGEAQKRLLEALNTRCEKEFAKGYGVYNSGNFNVLNAFAAAGFQTIKKLDLSTRLNRRLVGRGVYLIEQLKNISKENLLKQHGMGKNLYDELITTLNDFGYYDIVKSLENS